MLNNISVFNAALFCDDFFALVTRQWKLRMLSNFGTGGTGLCSVMQLYSHLPSSMTKLPCLKNKAEDAKYYGDRGVQVNLPGVVWVLHDKDGVIGGRQ